jgi:hypothetical protein
MTDGIVHVLVCASSSMAAFQFAPVHNFTQILDLTMLAVATISSYTFLDSDLSVNIFASIMSQSNCRVTSMRLFYDSPEVNFTKKYEFFAS